MFKASIIGMFVLSFCPLAVPLAADVAPTRAEQRALAQVEDKHFAFRDFLWAPTKYTVHSQDRAPRHTYRLSTMARGAEANPERPVRVVTDAAIQNAYVTPSRPKHGNILTVVFTYRGNDVPSVDRHFLLLQSKSGKTIGWFGFTSVVTAKGFHSPP